MVGLLVFPALVDYGAAKGLRALRDGRLTAGPSVVASVPGTGPGAPGADAGAPLGSGSPVTLEVPGTVAVGSRAGGVAVQAGVSLFVAPSLLDQIDLAGQRGATPVDPFGLPDSAGPGLPVAEANRGGLVAWLDDEPAVPGGSRACIFTPATSAGKRPAASTPR